MARFISTAGSVLFLMGCQSSARNESKPALADLLGLVDHPAVEAQASGGGEDVDGLLLNLEAGTFEVEHGTSHDHVAQQEGTCSDEELATGRELFSWENVERYEGSTVTVPEGERRLRFTVIWPPGAAKRTSAFTVGSANRTGDDLAAAVDYTERYFELYAPPAPSGTPSDDGCEDGGTAGQAAEPCPGLPPNQ